MKEDRYEVCFSGSGGQGIIMAAMVFAEAAGVYDKRHVCQTQSYGPEARGGKSKAEVVLSGRVIDYPKTLGLDLLLAMNQASCDAYFPNLKPEGLLVVDSTFVDQVPTGRSVSIPFTQLARKRLGSELFANMVALGAVGYLCQMVSLKGLEKAVTAKVPKGTEKTNRKALRMGVKTAREIDMTSLPPFITPEEEEM